MNNPDSNGVKGETKGLQIIVIALGVMILLATTALVVLVMKKPRRDAGANMVSQIASAQPSQILQGNYITSYAVGNNIVVVMDDRGKKTISLYDGASLKFLAKLVIEP